MVSFSFTPFSSMSTVCFRISTVWLMRSSGKGTWLGGASLTLTPPPWEARTLLSSILVFWPQDLSMDPEQETHAVRREEWGWTWKGTL